MDWGAAIEKNREALKRVLAMLVAMAGLENRQSASASRQPGSAADGSTDCLLLTADGSLLLPRYLHRAVLRLLRPAEAAARRLIIVAARGVVVAVRSSEACRAVPRAARRKFDIQLPCHSNGGATASNQRASILRPTFPLFDPLCRFHRRRPARNGVPRISFPGFNDPFPIPPAPSPDDAVDASRLALRFAALARVLDDLPREARRFARWKARRDRDSRGESPSPLRGEVGGGGNCRIRRVWPLRPGKPPGSPRRPTHEVHDILDVVHGLAFWALESPDTS